MEVQDYVRQKICLAVNFVNKNSENEVIDRYLEQVSLAATFSPPLHANVASDARALVCIRPAR